MFGLCKPHMGPPRTQYRGSYEVLSSTGSRKVKEIRLFPGGETSLQRHFKRNEHWFVLSGKGVALISENEHHRVLTHDLEEGGSIDIPVRTWHKLINISSKDSLVIIEIQTGKSFLEEDIERVDYASGTLKDITRS